jgi:hypothetical protein
MRLRRTRLALSGLLYGIRGDDSPLLRRPALRAAVDRSHTGRASAGEAAPAGQATGAG